MTTPNVSAPTKHLDLDILIIGAGFGGCYALYTLRQHTPSIHVFEAAPTLGGVWHWNTYPGARVDSEIPYYQYSIPEVWRHWTWSERFPGVDELQAYFRHVDQVLDLSKDVTFNASVVDARYDEKRAKWTVTTENGHVAVTTYLICATGSSYKAHYPEFKNLSKFTGQLIHSTRYPANANTQGARVAIIGSGATAVQCTQEIAKTASHLSVYIRTASISLPMVQRELSEIEQRINKASYNSMFAYTKQTNSGLGYDMRTGSVYDLTDEQREELWEELWSRGGFNFNQSNYRDFLIDTQANALMYQFWRRKVRRRIKNPEKAAFLAPEKPPFAFGTKRSSLEQDYYECLDQDNVSIFDLKTNPIEEFTETGIVTRDGVERQFDTVVLATGFDSMTGSLTEMNLRGRDGRTVKELWREGVLTYLGLCVGGCPNMFMVYGPQAPTAFTNGPTFIEVQVQIVSDFIQKLRKKNIKSIEAQLDAAKQWKDMIQADNNKTLLPLTDSWYMGANIPGKPREQLNYLRGVRQYNEDCRAALENFEGFDLVYNDRDDDDKQRLQSHI